MASKLNAFEELRASFVYVLVFCGDIAKYKQLGTLLTSLTVVNVRLTSNFSYLANFYRNFR